ncbi:MAG: hypothetical protein HY458_02460 [Parcubacteria group bacterium]|nr:hypothetical protein [Parcubacteria group bacterium]
MKTSEFLSAPVLQGLGMERKAEGLFLQVVFPARHVVRDCGKGISHDARPYDARAEDENQLVELNAGAGA